MAYFFDDPKQDITQMSDYSVEDNNEVDRSYFSQIPAKVMFAMSDFSKRNKWIVRKIHVNHFPTHWIGLLFPHF